MIYLQERVNVIEWRHVRRGAGRKERAIRIRSCVGHLFIGQACVCVSPTCTPRVLTSVFIVQYHLSVWQRLIAAHESSAHRVRLSTHRVHIAHEYTTKHAQHKQ
jgi:hypothetical protein